MENMDNVIVLTDENGQETSFEFITDLEVDGNVYYVLYPVDSEEEDAVVFKVEVDEDGQEVLSVIEDDEEFEKVAEAYQEWLDSDEDFEFDEE
ncbi:DUF1292 domain-containing protein [Caloramator sp. mosi_1]|uniref:DUF1292 domain-containing protein n=1 Tax=Caloramator sp. mosi_1 TaxID=3023090 RepID=UPI00236224BB|nr:DUF1292 domain-containing protein [Caloramator sp. mosi_1]MCX7695047.1 DUF1292 domain-containing protein [Caloramator sp.]WDC83765.1 DUF1292 domain-containing protein [Caloramator sp. mosi_1]